MVSTSERLDGEFGPSFPYRSQYLHVGSSPSIGRRRYWHQTRLELFPPITITLLKILIGQLLAINLPLESPCSPIIHPWVEDGATLRRSESRKRNRDESKLVPEPMTRSFGKPLNFHATYVKRSTVTRVKKNKSAAGYGKVFKGFAYRGCWRPRGLC